MQWKLCLIFLRQDGIQLHTSLDARQVSGSAASVSYVGKLTRNTQRGQVLSDVKLFSISTLEDDACGPYPGAREEHILQTERQPTHLWYDPNRSELEVVKLINLSRASPGFYIDGSVFFRGMTPKFERRRQLMTMKACNYKMLNPLLDVKAETSPEQLIFVEQEPGLCYNKPVLTHLLREQPYTKDNLIASTTHKNYKYKMYYKSKQVLVNATLTGGFFWLRGSAVHTDGKKRVCSAWTH